MSEPVDRYTVPPDCLPTLTLVEPIPSFQGVSHDARNITDHVQRTDNPVHWLIR